MNPNGCLEKRPRAWDVSVRPAQKKKRPAFFQMEAAFFHGKPAFFHERAAFEKGMPHPHRCRCSVGCRISGVFAVVTS